MPDRSPSMVARRPNGAGRAVRISGYEEWTFDPDGRIARSLGHFDAADYQRQLEGTAQQRP